jgi:hypothetical protein
MSLDVSKYIWKHTKQKGTPLLLLLAIADFADDQGVAFPGVERLAEMARVDKRNTQRHINTLIADGELVIDVNNGTETRSGNTNRYYLVQYRRSIGIDSEELKSPKIIPPPKSRKKTSGVALEPSVGVALEPSVGVALEPSKPSVEPSVEPSVKDIAGGKAPAKAKRKSKANSTTHPLYQQTRDAIIQAFGWNPKDMGTSDFASVGKVANDLLSRQTFTPIDIPNLYEYCTDRYSTFGVHALASNFKDYRTANPPIPEKYRIKLEQAHQRLQSHDDGEILTECPPDLLEKYGMTQEELLTKWGIGKGKTNNAA